MATAAEQVPSGPDWIHEVKHDGYRMLVIRENERVRLLSRNGTDWTKRYPWIAEAALKNRQKRFVIDGEAVILGADGISDSTLCTAANTMTRCSCTPLTSWLWAAMICGPFPSTFAKQICSSYWPAGRMASAWRRLSEVRSGQTSSGPLAAWDLRAWFPSTAIGRTVEAGRSTGSR
nr:hypothetical protein [Bradyrhizobium glycinis]